MEPFNINNGISYSHSDLIVTQSNAKAHSDVFSSSTWLDGRLLILGPRRSGKTFLAKIWADHEAAHIVDTNSLDESVTHRVYEHQNAIVEDIHILAGNPSQEIMLFQICNNISINGGRMLMTATGSPQYWNITLPDLFSRIQGSKIVCIEMPDAEMLLRLYIKLFSDRHITISNDLIKFIARRGERTYEAVEKTVIGLDRLSLASRKKITRPMIEKYIMSLK